MRVMMGKSILFFIFISIACFWEIDGRRQQIKPGCWYEGKRYQEGQVVNTTEPCLRCRCNDGSLRCRLRICPRLPSPAPFGCTTRTPRDNACCAELVCGDSHERNVTARRDPAEDVRRQEEGCLHEGVRYGPGSAMMGSQRCEYCYCISGSRRCLRPRCLLPLPGCIPLYAPYSCCPVAYNCNNSADHSLPSLGSSSPLPRNGCRVGDRSYDEGEMVRDIEWKGTCDNCFCAMGGVRCVPLACAPPLQGCTPIVREGHCCPSTYNCSGTIEVKATQNYASYAFVSKDYAKFRKENNFFSMEDEVVKEEGDVYKSTGNSTVEGRGHKNPQQRIQTTSKSLETLTESTTIKTTSNSSIFNERQSLIFPDLSTTIKGKNLTTLKSTTVSSQDNETMDNEIPTETLDIEKFSTQGDTTLSIDWTTTNDTTEVSITTLESITSLDISGVTTALPNVESLDSTNSIFSPDETSLPPFEISTVQLNEETTVDFSIVDDYSTTIYEEERTSSLPVSRESVVKMVTNKTIDDKSSTQRIVESTTKYSKISDSTRENNNNNNNNNNAEKNGLPKFGLVESSVISVKGPATGSPTTILMPDNMFVINVTLRTNVSVGHVQGVTINPVRSIPPDIEAILNITNRKKGEDYEYDYSQPTLPPSLPNVRIIPFVAADALVKQGEEVSSQVTNYPLGSVGLPPQELGPTVASGTAENFYDIVTQKNRFSPPIETEGGFVPREPPYYDPPYRSTDHNLEIHSGVTTVPADITNSHRKNDELAGICVFENRNYRHGDLLPSSGHCIICICYYGEVACSDEKCPPLKIGCSRLKIDKICCGKIICVDAEESPTVVLDRADAIAPSPREPLPSLDGMASPDPFRDVIKTKPAPDLPSLIEDMIPYFVEHRITKPSAVTTPMTTTTMTTTTTTTTILESSIAGHFETRPDHKFIQETTNNRDFSLANGPAEETSSLNNKTKSRQKIQQTIGKRTSTIGPLELTTRWDKDQNETPLFGERAPPDNPDLIPVLQDEDDSSIFSFGSVFDLLFSENIDTQVTTAASKSLENTTPKDPADISSDFSHNMAPKFPANMPPNFSVNVQPDFPSNMPDLSPKIPPKLPSKMPPSSSANGPSKISPNNPPEITVNATPNLSIESVPEQSADKVNETVDNSSLSSMINVTRLSTASTPGTITWIKVKESQRTTTKIPGTESSMIDQRVTTIGDNEVATSVGGLLKLAGCNIYGRMYRVGRIITELSSPCLECRCTEVGVQCKQLEC